MEKKSFETIDEYIAACAPEIQPVLHAVRSAIREAAPEAGEKISWGMATFTLNGNLVHFAAEKNHIGLHPGSSGVEAFISELSGYSFSKGTIRLPYDQPLPLDLIRRIVRFRVDEQKAIAAEKTMSKAKKPTPRPRHPMPDAVSQALEQAGLWEAYQARPPYQQNDYIGWIARAKRDETREKRLTQMLDELRAGDVYMGMPY